MEGAFPPRPTAAHLAEAVRDARARTLELVADLTDEQLLGPRLPIVNPPRWEIGHVAWFQERWVLRNLDHALPLRADADSLYDSEVVAHDTRWDLPLPTRKDTVAYVNHVRDAVLARLEQGEPDQDAVYFNLLSILHEDMHGEAFTYMRQTLGLPRPRLARPAGSVTAGREGPFPRDAAVPGGRFVLGSDGSGVFAWDNERRAHDVELAPFQIARAAVTQAEFADFVKDGGYQDRSVWSHDGWRWRESVNAVHPIYWRRGPGGAWQRRDFDKWVPLEPSRPVIHVAWHEAEAFCRWARRRLPSEAEWEVAASFDPASSRQRRFPWGDEPPSPELANLDWRAGGALDVGALPQGDSPVGCRQMIGNVWEWTASVFEPYPGFRPDPYEAYSKPWFGTRRVLRGGCWTTRSRLVTTTFRNFYEPHRRDVFAGFRTCAS